MQGSIGIDIGGTKIAIGLVDASGKILERRSFPTEVGKGPEAITREIAEAVLEIAQSSKLRIEGAGVGIAGQIDPRTGVVHFAPNLHWKNFPLAKQLSEQLGMPIGVVNDVRAAAWGEWIFGAGKGQKNLVCLFVGTGIGGGIAFDGKILEGATNCAGELGHIVVDLAGPLCSCGGFGCLEAIAGGWAIAQKATQRAAADRRKGDLLLQLCKGSPEMLTAKLVSLAAAQKDPMAMEILEEAKKGLIAGVTSIVNAFNPACVVLGGGVLDGNPVWVQEIDERVRQRALNAAAKELIIRGSLLKGDAGVVGAAYCVLKSIQ